MPNVAWVVAVATTAAAVLAGWLIGGWGGPSATAAASMIGLPTFAAFATVCAAWAARSSRDRPRLAWLCLAIGLAGWTLGELLSAFYRVVLHENPFPSLADAGYLLYPVGACAALLLFPLGHTPQSRTRMLLDGLIVAGALLEVSWVLVLRSTFEARGDGAFQVALALAYPVTDVVIVTIALLILVRARGAALILLTIGNVLAALSDSAWVYLEARHAYFEGDPVDIGWLAGLLLVGVAALLGTRRGAADAWTEAPTRAELWMPYVPVLIAALACTPWLLTLPGVPLMLVSSTLLISAVLLRQFLVVGQNRRLLAIVARQALQDPLTGAANRALFHDRLTHAMQLQERDGLSVAVLLIDLDDFKFVNDTLGHPAGDTMLIQAARRILGCVRTGDTVARLGGDEFAILMEGNPDHAHVIAQRVVRAFDDPFVVDGHAVPVRLSAGLAMVAADDASTVSTEALLKRADTAMYSAKRSGAGGLRLFDDAMHADTRSKRGEMGGRLLDELRTAIDNLGLTLVYQPKFDLESGVIVGVEALVRWPHPELGLLTPDQFLPLVHRHGLVRSVTDLVLTRALDDAADWCARGVGVPIAVNISAPSLSDLGLPVRVEQALSSRGLSADALTVEITEDLLVDNTERARAVVEGLRSRGVRVAIDDFGSGYSALSYLRDLPIDEVKLDRQFVGPIVRDARAAAIVRAVIDLAHVLDVTTVAEGVEDGETAAALREYGCDVVQGYFYSPPVDTGVLLTLLGAQTHCDGEGSAADCVGTSRREIELMQ